MASRNTNLHKAKTAKNDEFYTQLTDVSKELMHDAEPMVRRQAAQSDNRAVLDFLTTDRDATVARCARRTLFDLDDELSDNL